MGSGALVVALPFACVLGFLASIAASTIGEAIQIGCVSPEICNKK
jgi:hypothetical protein